MAHKFAVFCAWFYAIAIATWLIGHVVQALGVK